MTVISIDHVSKFYKLKHGEQICALDDITLQIKDGDTLALVGPSGSGKTTLLRIIAGLETPDSGQVFYDGKPIAEVSTYERGIGMVFQEYALIPQWNARDNIGFYLRLRRRQREVPERVHQISRITGVDIDKLMGKFPKQLSGGEKQRVAIARAFARDLEILLFDEPFANLDAKFRMTARVEARRLLNQFPVTMVYVTHDQQEAAVMAEKIIVMREGHIEQVGDYQHLYHNPTNLFVAQFIGTPIMNLFKGQVQGGKWQGEHFGGYPIAQNLPDGHTVTLAIRPENVQIGGEIAATVETVIPYFAERHTLIDVQLGTEKWQLQIPLTDEIRPNDMLHCHFDESAILYFDTATGERLE